MVIITSIVAVVSTGCALTGNIAKVEWIGTGPVYGHLTVKLVPTDNAEAHVRYTVELWEKGKLRDATGHVIWSQPELNVHTAAVLVIYDFNLHLSALHGHDDLSQRNAWRYIKFVTEGSVFPAFVDLLFVHSRYW